MKTPLRMHPTSSTDLAPTTSAKAPARSNVEAVARPWTEEGQNAREVGRWRSDVIWGRPTTIKPLVALQAKLTPESWNVTAIFCNREAVGTVSLIVVVEEVLLMVASAVEARGEPGIFSTRSVCV
jgi:hypothetical protein